MLSCDRRMLLVHARGDSAFEKSFLLSGCDKIEGSDMEGSLQHPLLLSSCLVNRIIRMLDKAALSQASLV